MKELLEKLQKLGRDGKISSVNEINFVRRRNKNRPQTKKISTADEIRTDCGRFSRAPAMAAGPTGLRRPVPSAPSPRRVGCAERHDG